ncbi:MAG: hypothetical protein HYY32_06635 [Chloroflexi bacterium]|nr:hypothetical protein [Chloroflexota bacterium]
MANTGSRLFEAKVTRRSFLLGSIGVTTFIVAAGGMVQAIAGCAKKKTADFIVASSTDFNHSHNITISGADVDSPPSAGKTITSDGATHTHQAVLTKAHFASIGKGEQVVVTSTATGTTPHTHTFTIKKPA